jgi:hypothetical protein
MQKQIIALLVALILAPSAWSDSRNSQVRLPGVSAKQTREGLKSLFPHVLEDPASAVAMEVPFDQLDFSQVTPWRAEADVNTVFEAVRDQRYLFTLGMPTFPRRISWLYPDDGCYARAAMTNKKLDEWGIQRMNKLFIFGDLNVRTNNSYGGMVEWWYHNVPVTQKDGVVYVFDAAVEPSRALPIDDWVRLMGQGTKSITAAICDPYAYSPWDRCILPSHDVESDAQSDQEWFLNMEWSQLDGLGRQPDKELGEHPPWKKLVENRK